ncbi:hypothetical protein K3G63_11905 [Hymenobacter sp. HSC-4F20]|uniref:hypothetical protein n=1 Tax=Hymenobacter sp. HSC-4F20 TaxID=2864135 RepID=UPI001C72BC0E|nr:hypothetical protein [Hymenobacter sp. HSC-4F20]MBX0291151.1 hypothetical protein [Hymenobacter sp. HSC-4F20]
MTAPYSEYLHLTYRPDLRMLVLRWLRDASMEELQAGCQAALHLAQQHQTAHWFVDVRRRLATRAEHSAWMADTFLPAAAAQLLPTPLRVGYLISPARLEAIQSQPAVYNAAIVRTQSAAQPYRMRIFLNEAEAIHWLLAAE